MDSMTAAYLSTQAIQHVLDEVVKGWEKLLSA